MNRGILLLALALSVIAIAAFLYLVVAAMGDKPIDLDSLIDDKAIYYGEEFAVEGYVVKVMGEETSYELRSNDVVARQGRKGILLAGENLDPFVAYIQTDRYRTIHGSKAVVIGELDNKGNLRIKRIRFA